MTDVTKELRAKLDELGVEHYDASHKRKAHITSWASGDAVFCFTDESPHQTDLHIENCIPEQAIAATVGVRDGTIDMDWVRDLVERHSDHTDGNGRTFHNGAYAHMAEEIAATVGTGTCKDLGGIGADCEVVFHCSECGCILSVFDKDGMNNLCTSFIYDYPRFCPECGKRIINKDAE